MISFVRAGIISLKTGKHPGCTAPESIRRIIDSSLALDITSEPYASYNNRMNHVVEPGGFDRMVSNSSPDVELRR